MASILHNNSGWAGTKLELRRAAKCAAASFFGGTGIRQALSAWERKRVGGRRVLIVSYHRVVGDFRESVASSIPGLLVSQRTFERHLEDAHRAGYELASLSDALRVLAGEKRARKDLFVVTFDDGYRDVYRYAHPVLQRKGVPSTIYLPSQVIGTSRRFSHDRLYHLLQLARRAGGVAEWPVHAEWGRAFSAAIASGNAAISACIDGFLSCSKSEQVDSAIEFLEGRLSGRGELLPKDGDVMDWEEVRRMARSGTELGAHTLRHVVLTNESAETIGSEVAQSKAQIEREAGVAVRDFAYCNGWYSNEVVSALIAAGFRSGVTTEDVPNRVGSSPFTLKRKVLWESFSQGPMGAYSSQLTRCHFDGVFGALGVRRPVLGDKGPSPRQESP